MSMAVLDEFYADLRTVSSGVCVCKFYFVLFCFVLFYYILSACVCEDCVVCLLCYNVRGVSMVVDEFYAEVRFAYFFVL